MLVLEINPVVGFVANYLCLVLGEHSKNVADDVFWGIAKMPQVSKDLDKRKDTEAVQLRTTRVRAGAAKPESGSACHTAGRGQTI